MSRAPGASREREVALALELARLARPIILEHWRRPLPVDVKDDLSPVTAADRNAEAAMRRAINAAFPEHGILGEEYGPERIDADFVWVLDPIDGTKSFITGKPLFGTLIGLTWQGLPVAGVIDMPALDEVWLGADDRGATLNGTPVGTRACAELGSAMLYSTSPDMFKGADSAAFARVAGAVRHPLYGADCYGYAMVAAGWADLVIESSLKPYDYCACVAVLEAAGGGACDWEGRPLGKSSGARVLAYGDRRLRDPVLERLAG